MASADWSNPNGAPFRYNTTVQADPRAKHPEHPAVFAIWGRDQQDEAHRFAELVAYLKESKVIEDYSQVALLLHSVRQEHSGHYLEALAERGSPAFSRRARAYFDNREVRDLVACFALIFGWYGSARGEVTGAVAELA